jgi:ribosomal protein L24
MPVAINPGNLWRLANTNFLKKIGEKARGKFYDFVVGDVVRVRSGSECGKIGKVRRILPEIDQLIVEGVHQRVQPITMTKNGVTQTNFLILDRAIPVACVELLHPQTLKATGPLKRQLKDTGFGYSKLTRIIAQTGEELDFPTERGLTPAGPFDTPALEASKVTYVPNLNKNPLPYGLII